MQHSQISFIIPAYNRSEFLFQAIRSIYRQTIQPFEIIVVDDSSKTPLKGLIVQKFPKVKVIRLAKNSGPSAARNRGLKAASGTYVCLLDSDDVLSPYFSQKMLTTLKAEKREVPVVCCSIAIFSQDYSIFMKFVQTFVNRLRNTVLFFLYLKNNGYLIKESFFAVTLSRLIIPRASLKMVSFNEEMRNCEDWDFILKLMQRTQIKILPKNLVYYRFDKNSFTYFERKRTGWANYDALVEKLPPSSQAHPLIVGFKVYKSIFSKF